MRRDPLTEPFEGEVEVFRSPDERSARERALVLRAKEIPFRYVRLQGAHRLFVEAHQAERGLQELSAYEEENRGRRSAGAPPPPMPGAWTSTAAALGVLVTLYLLDRGNLFDLNWRGAGIAHADAIRRGELWRAVTALMLHDGPVHLASNLVFLGFFGFLAAYVHGLGLAWLAIFCAGTLGNLANAWIQPSEHLSLGASTAVFGAIGILAGSEWRRRFLLRQRRILVLMPLVVALWFLGWFGIPQDPKELVFLRVDIFAHVFGLLSGIPIGALLPFFLERGARRRNVQAALGAAALLFVLFAWIWAFSM